MSVFFFATSRNMFHVGCTLISIFRSKKKKKQKRKKRATKTKMHPIIHLSVRCACSLRLFTISSDEEALESLYLRNAETWTMKCHNWLPPNHYKHVNENPICCLCNYLFSSLCFLFFGFVLD